MPRPKKKRWVVSDPDVRYFKPRGVPLRALEEVGLALEELEALRLADMEGLSHEEAGKRMNVSRATFGRIVQSARRSVAQALVNGMAIRIEGGDYLRVAPEGKNFFCRNCNREWKIPGGYGHFKKCPECGKTIY